jgi:transposase-like protein
MILLEVQQHLSKETRMSKHTEQRRHQAINRYLADDKVEDICRQLTCSKSWLYKWRDRYDAHNPAWAQERSKRPKSHPTQTLESVERAVVSLHLTLLHNGTGAGVTAITHALAQQGIEPVPSRRTLYRIVRRHHKGVQ